MQNAVAIVTGGGTGIGAAVVRRLAARGVRCVINYSSSRDDAEALAAEIGENAIAVQANIADDAQCRALVSSAKERWGRLDFLVNNAGRSMTVRHEDMDAIDAEDFIAIYRLNTIAAFQMIRAATPFMREHGIGAVVNVASMAGVYGGGSSLAYAASKGALITLTQSFARVLAPEIRVNVVAPGYVGTGWIEKAVGKEKFAALDAFIAQKMPMAIAPRAEDIAGPIEMLLDPSSRVITGELVMLDAGEHLDVGLTRRPGREMM